MGAMAWTWFSIFLEKALVSRVNRRIDLRIVRFWRSTYDVLTCAGSGSPSTGRFSIPMHAGAVARLRPAVAGRGGRRA